MTSSTAHAPHTLDAPLAEETPHKLSPQTPPNEPQTPTSAASPKPPCTPKHRRTNSADGNACFLFPASHEGLCVELFASFGAWQGIRMEFRAEKGGYIHETQLDVGHHLYYFKVDGKVAHLPNEATTPMPDGTQVHVYQVLTRFVGSMIRSQSNKNISEKLSLLTPGIQMPPETTGKHTTAPLHSRVLDDTKSLAEKRLVIVMVGLPARGKSYVARKIMRFLTWIGHKVKIFNLGDYRRKLKGNFQNHDFFRADNDAGQAMRRQAFDHAFEDMITWLRDEQGNQAIFDGTNSTCDRRRWFMQKLTESDERYDLGIKVIFIELICDDPEIVEKNVLTNKIHLRDYEGMDKSQAVKDFRERIAHYESVYEGIAEGELEESHLSYVKIYNVGMQVVTNRMLGYVPSRLVYFLMNLHIEARPIYFVRHGESEFNKNGLLGGDPPLTDTGLLFANKLKDFMSQPPMDEETINEHFDPSEKLAVWTSTMRRSIQTAEHVPCAQLLRWRALDEIEAGLCDGMSYKEIEAKMPHEYKARQTDKLRYRYPRGESYEDVIRRLEPVIMELERHRNPVLVVAHQAVLRCLFAYFKGLDPEDVPHTTIDLHTVFRLLPHAYGTVEKQYPLLDD